MTNFVSLGDYEYNPAEILGNGAFAIVYKGHEKNNESKLVAIKRMVKEQSNIKSISLLKKEIAVLKELNNENIVQLYSHNISSNCVYLVMEHCNGGDLSEYLLKNKTLSEDTIRSLLSQIGSAMHSMHKKGVIHRDLKPSNILLCYNPASYKAISSVPAGEINFKLADFGFARFLEHGMMAATMCGSPMYMAPEVLTCSKYNSLADIWSMGIIVFQCLTGKAPFYANTPEALKDLYVRTARLVPKIPYTTSQELHDLLLKMLVRIPKDRINYDSFLSHSFLLRKSFKTRTYSGSKGALLPTRSNSGDDLRTVTYSTQDTKCYYSRRLSVDTSRPNEIPKSRPIPINEKRPNVLSFKQRSSPVKIQEDLFDDDFVIVNKDGSELIRRRTVSEGLSTKQETLFDKRKSCEVPLNLIGPCNTSPDFRQNFLDSGFQAQDGGSPTNPTVLLRNTSAGHVRPPSCPNLLPLPRVLNRKISNEDKSSQLSSPSEPKFFLGSLGRKRTYSYNSTMATSPPNNDGFRVLSDSFNPFRSKPSALKEAIRELGGAADCDERPPISSKTATFFNLNELEDFDGGERITAERRSCTAPGDMRFISDLERYRKSSQSQERSNFINEIDPALLVQPPPLLEENIMELEHTETVKSVCSILELCQILMELAESRSTPLSMAQINTTPFTLGTAQDSVKLNFASEAQRVMEQIALYKRILTCLEEAFKEFRTAFESQKLKATSLSRRKLHECNSIYHRCYIRLRNLVREARREDLLAESRAISPSISAERLVFEYAGCLFSAADACEYSGDFSMSLSRFRKCATLLHGLCRFCDSSCGINRSVLLQLFELVQNKYNSMCKNPDLMFPFN